MPYVQQAVIQRAELEIAKSMHSTTEVTSVLFSTYFIICLDSSESQQQLKTEQIVGANGLQLKQFAKSYQLRPFQVFQGQLILKELGETYNLLGTGLMASVTNLNKAQASGAKAKPEENHSL